MQEMWVQFLDWEYPQKNGMTTHAHILIWKIPWRGAWWSTAQFSSVTHSCPTLCDPMDCRMPGFRVHHQFPEFTQTRVH